MYGMNMHVCVSLAFREDRGPNSKYGSGLERWLSS